MKKIQTLKNKKEFDFVYKNSSKYRSHIYDICVLESKYMDNFYMKFKRSQKTNIVGFIVSKKTGKAVERNLIKRQLRSICDLFLCEFLDDNSMKFIFIIIAKEKIKQIPFLNLKKGICSTLLSIKK